MTKLLTTMAKMLKRVPQFGTKASYYGPPHIVPITIHTYTWEQLIFETRIHCICNKLCQNSFFFCRHVIFKLLRDYTSHISKDKPQQNPFLKYIYRKHVNKYISRYRRCRCSAVELKSKVLSKANAQGFMRANFVPCPFSSSFLQYA